MGGNEKLNMDHQKLSFAQKHPKINLIIGLALLIVIAWLVFIVIEWLFGKLGLLLSKLGKMDAVVITAIIAGAVSITGVVISSIVAKTLEFKKSRQEYLAQKREEPYGEFIEMVYKLTLNKDNNHYKQENMVRDLSSFSRKITLWGSKDVVKKWVQFRKNAANPEGAMRNLLLIDDIMNAMRKDLGVKSVDQKELLDFFINDPENITTNMKSR